MVEALLSALANLATLQHILHLVLGVMLGLAIGAFPGLGGIAGLSIMVPFLYGMDTVSALATLVGLVAVIPTSDTFTSILMGIPGYRLTLDDRIAIDVLPRGITTLSVTIKNAAAAILEVRASHSIVLWEEIFSDPDIELWKSLLFSDIDSPNKIHMEN